MRIFIVGGTGFLGYYATLEALRRGHEVSTISLPDVELGEWFTPEVQVSYGDVFEMGHHQLVETFKGYDAMVYAVGPDDRVTPPAPAYEFFHKRLVDYATRVVGGARDAGVKRCVVLNSYFAYFDRMWPNLHLQARHPYIKARVEQAESVIREGDGEMDVMVLELPYIFGTMPGRVPLWKDILVARVQNMNPVVFPKGGTNMLAVEHVGEAVVGAIEHGQHGERYLVGDVNMEWKTMLRLVLDALGVNRKVYYIPTKLAVLYGMHLKNQNAREGKEGGLNPAYLMQDIQARFLYFDPAPHADALGYGRGGIEAAINQTVKACIAPL